MANARAWDQWNLSRQCVRALHQNFGRASKWHRERDQNLALSRLASEVSCVGCVSVLIRPFIESANLGRIVRLVAWPALKKR